jgi:phthalate 4,5-cis-dihydrodiol dehydrogenase
LLWLASASKPLAICCRHCWQRDRFQVVAFVDPIRKRRDAMAKRLGVPASFHSVDHLLADGGIDAIVAACPPQAHEQIAAEAIAAGIPVFVEKPPATSTASLAELAKAASDSGVITGVGMNFRWARPVRRIRAMVDSGAYGRPVMVNVRHV